MGETIVVALGGNSLITDASHVSVHDQYEAARHTVHNMLTLIGEGHDICIVHGNGPQVGFILRRVELARKELHYVPLDSLVADTQGALGYNIQMALDNEMRLSDLHRPAVTVVTQVVVDRDDPAFLSPDKPIGAFMDRETALKHRQEDGWAVMEDSGRGYRRVTPSPVPLQIIELEAIRVLLSNGILVVAAGGGGIPVVEREDGTVIGVEAVIDKDRTAGLLAAGLPADRFVISTAVEQVYLDYGKPTQQPISRMTVAEAKRYIHEEQFGRGSMLPKIEAMARFVEETGRNGVITDPAHLAAAIEGKAGTLIIP